MDIFKNKRRRPDADLRNISERRTREQKWRHDRRVRPDRRLNNILVEEISFSEVTSNPELQGIWHRPVTRKRVKGTPRNEHSVVCMFRSSPGAHEDLRKTTDRRTQQQIWPYNRRVHPDRRLNNISVEWITTW